MKNKMRMASMIFVAAALYAGVMEPANAISAGYRAQLERSGCTEVSDLNHTCGIKLTKAQNQRKNAGQKLRDVAHYAESTIGEPIGEVADHMLADGWKANNGDWHKGKWTIRLVVENEKVVNAQVF